MPGIWTVSYTHLRAHETVLDLVCRLLLANKKKQKKKNNNDYTTNHASDYFAATYDYVNNSINAYTE